MGELIRSLKHSELLAMQFRTRAIHVGNEADPQTGAVVPPVHVASTFVQPGAGVWGAFDYTRSGNPTRKAFETTLADLESGVGGLAFASGMAAIHAVTMLLKTGDHVLAGADIYGGTYRLLHKIVDRAGISVTLVDTTDLAAVEAAVRPNTKLLWIESPGNPRMSITDIAGCAAIAKRRGFLLGVDNTFATPVLTRPLELGADIVMHSATKYIGGHSDLLGGALVVREKELFERLYFIQNAAGAVMAPWESYLCSRGLKTLELRVREHGRTAQQLAEWLSRHPRVEKVLYPGLPLASGARNRQAADGRRIRRDAQFRFGRSFRRGEESCGIDAADSIGGQPRRGGIADRTAGIDVACQLRRGRSESTWNFRRTDSPFGWLGGV